MTRPDSDSPPPAARRQALRRQLAMAILVIGLIVGTIVTHAVWSGTRALAAGDGAHARADERTAIAYWGQAARWYVPGSAHVELAYQRLEEIAHAAETRDDLATAAIAWGTIRTSILATRSGYLPHTERFERATNWLQRTAEGFELAPQAATRTDAAATGSTALGADTSSPATEDAPRVRFMASADIPGPALGWLLLVLFGFALWLGGGLLFVLRAVTTDDGFIPRTAAYAGVLVGVGLVFWLLGLHGA